MNINVLLATTQAPTISESLPYLLGMVMVLATLATLWGITVIMAKIVRIFLPSEVKHPPAAAKPLPVAANHPDDTIPAGVVAAIAAAVAATIDSPARIISIKSGGTSWAAAGRQSVLSSHRIR